MKTLRELLIQQHTQPVYPFNVHTRKFANRYDVFSTKCNKPLSEEEKKLLNTITELGNLNKEIGPSSKPHWFLAIKTKVKGLVQILGPLTTNPKDVDGRRTMLLSEIRADGAEGKQYVVPTPHIYAIESRLKNVSHASNNMTKHINPEPKKFLEQIIENPELTNKLPVINDSTNDIDHNT